MGEYLISLHHHIVVRKVKDTMNGCFEGVVAFSTDPFYKVGEVNKYWNPEGFVPYAAHVTNMHAAVLKDKSMAEKGMTYWTEEDLR